MPHLIVNADDFGASPYTNRAIIHAHNAGIVTSSTAMMNLPDAAPGLEQALQAAPTLGLGVHINLTNGKPISPPDQVPSLVDENGYFYPIDMIAVPSLNFDGDELYQEIAAQIEHFVAVTGKNPTHLDAHYHVALFHPLAIEATLTLAAEYGVAIRESQLQNIDKPAALARLQQIMPQLPGSAVMILLDSIETVVARSPAAHMPAHFDTRFFNPNNTLGDLLNYITDVPNGGRPVELMCHPGLMDDPTTDNGVNKQRETDALTHPTTREVIERLDIELVNFGAYPRP
ncbi:MAG: ChbG/HpnK family deacetylase [Chloroflexi bacterium]|nr:ChbG/HpnK family deacetylase [Chloroflexota bacterium]